MPASSSSVLSATCGIGQVSLTLRGVHALLNPDSRSGSECLPGAACLLPPFDEPGALLFVTGLFVTGLIVG